MAILIALEQNVGDIQVLLKKAGYVMSKSLPGDVIVMWVLENNAERKSGTSRLFQINTILDSLGLPLLMTRPRITLS